MLGHFAGFGGLSIWKRPDADSSHLGRLCDRVRAYACEDYAVIAARSGWTPMMFITA